MIKEFRLPVFHRQIADLRRRFALLRQKATKSWLGANAGSGVPVFQPFRGKAGESREIVALASFRSPGSGNHLSSLGKPRRGLAQSAFASCDTCVSVPFRSIRFSCNQPRRHVSLP